MPYRCLIALLFFLHQTGCSSSRPQTPQGNLSLIILPAGQADLRAPGRGAEQWHDQNRVEISYQGDSVTYGADKYFRFSWTQLETDAGKFDWTTFDHEIKDAIDHKQLFSFGIMPACPSCSDDGKSIRIDDKIASYPAYLHALMQREEVKDWISPESEMWVPNWNSPSYLAALNRLCKAVNDRLQTQSYKGRRYRDVIRYIDLRGFGSYGEWHEAAIVQTMSDHPGGTQATAATLKRIVDIHLDAFADFRLVALMGSLDGDLLRNTRIPPEVGVHILEAQTKMGPLGIRRDNWGATDGYIRNYMETHPVEYQGFSFRKAITERWKTAPIVGEPIHDMANYNGCAMGDLENQVRRQHASSFGNGNFADPGNTCLQKSVRAAARTAGYRLQLEGGTIDSTVVVGNIFPVTLYWRNSGVAPLYEPWTVYYQLHRLHDDAQVWEGTSSFTPRLFLPADTATAHTDELSLPISLPPGHYNLRLSVRDPKGYLHPLPLANGGRQANGSYPLRTIEVVSDKL